MRAGLTIVTLAVGLLALAASTVPASHELDDQYVCVYEGEITFPEAPLPSVASYLIGEHASWGRARLAARDAGVSGAPGCFQRDNDGGDALTGPFHAELGLDGWWAFNPCVLANIYAFDETSPNNGWSAAWLTTPEGTARFMWDSFLAAGTGYTYTLTGRDGDGDRIWGSGVISGRMHGSDGQELTACSVDDVRSIQVRGTLVLTALAENL